MNSATLGSGPRLIRLFPDGVETWPFWENVPETGPSQPTAAELGLSDNLSKDVSAWVEYWREHFWPDLKWETPQQRADYIEWGEGLRLRVSAELGPAFEVVLVVGGL